MGKRQVHVIVVRKAVTVALLAVTSFFMLVAIYALAGHAYVRETHSTGDLVASALRLQGTEGPAIPVIALMMPVVANALIFVPWGFLAFIALDSPSRPRAAVYAWTLAGGVAFALAAGAWQSFLPSRVSMPSDVIANAAGAAAGAFLGHLRKQVWVRFEF